MVTIYNTPLSTTSEKALFGRPGGGMEVGCCGSEVHQHTADVTSDAMGIGVAFVEGSVYFLPKCVPVVVIGYVRVGLVCDDVSFGFLQGD